MAVKDVEKFIQTVYYSRKKEESLTEIRVRLYKQIKTKTFQSLPPDEKSMLQAIKCILYYLYYWLRVYKAIINDILLQDNLWIVNNGNSQ